MRKLSKPEVGDFDISVNDEPLVFTEKGRWETVPAELAETKVKGWPYKGPFDDLIKKHGAQRVDYIELEVLVPYLQQKLDAYLGVGPISAFRLNTACSLIRLWIREFGKELKLDYVRYEGLYHPIRDDLVSYGVVKASGERYIWIGRAPVFSVEGKLLNDHSTEGSNGQLRVQDDGTQPGTGEKSQELTRT